MKRKPLPIVHAEENVDRLPWRSALDLDPVKRWEAASQEFPDGAAKPPDAIARRTFVQLMLASMALAACSKPPERNILPYTDEPVDVTPGNPLSYATAWGVGPYKHGLLVQAREGHPVKIEGNPSHPASLGATGAIDQALHFGLYDPARRVQFLHRKSPSTWRAFLDAIDELATAMEANGGERLGFLVEPSASPLRMEMRRRLRQRFPKARIVAFASVDDDNAHEGARIAFGAPLEPGWNLGAARVVLSLDDDFLASGPEWLRLAREFTQSHMPGDGMSRLYAVEPELTVTGMMADHRLRMAGTRIPVFAAQLVKALAALPGMDRLAPIAAAAHAPAPDRLHKRWVDAIARDLRRAGKNAAILVGRRMPPALHALAAAMNDALGATGTMLTWRTPQQDVGVGAEPLARLSDDLRAGALDTLVITAWNPVYAAPADLGLASALDAVRHVVYHAPTVDETARHAEWVVPAAHELESWGDARAADGTVSIVQPLITPLFEGKTEDELLAAFTGHGGVSAWDLVRGYWQDRAKGTDFDARWERWLQDGRVEESALPSPPSARAAVNVGAVASAVGALPAPPDDDVMEISFRPDSSLWDGRFANNPYLQEMPDPVTKLTWGNAALVSPATAKALGVDRETILEVTNAHGATLKLPALPVPGHADGMVTVMLGYGRNAPEESVSRAVGANANFLRRTSARWFDRVTVRATRATERLAITQDHWTMEGRRIALSESMDEWEKGSAEAREKRREKPQIMPPFPYTGHKWGMAVDMSRCTGCSACVIACQAENNVPTVGREQVWRAREMHWLRIDRYFEGAEEEPEVVNQPMACVHCERAPCEYVCPVEATLHSDEGLNEMIYNRCVGTRFCSNNCPYKVRRFNFFDWSQSKPRLYELAENPEVTVRSRGVMEKCSYCVQRIERARIQAHDEGREIREGEWVTACAQACPTRAIVVGDLNDEKAAVTKLHEDPRAYGVLDELNTAPRTFHLTRVRNKNPELV